MIEIPTDLAADVVPLSWLLGVWEGTGVIDYHAGDRRFEGEFTHRVSFSHDGGDFLNYSASARTTDGKALVAETGYWRLVRAATDSDPGPALLPASATAVRTVDDVEAMRAPSGGFEIEVALVHSDGVGELYLGQVRGPRIDIATDAVVRPAGAKPYTAATRMYGLVDGHLLWAWDVAALGGELRLARLGTTGQGAVTVDGFARVPGAVVDEVGLVHVGNPLGEQRRLADGTALAPMGDRAVLAVTGEDRLSWLDSLTSQSLVHLEPGASTELLVLDPQGHIEHAASVVDDGERTWLIVDRSHAAPLLAWLVRMRFRLRVDPRDVSDAFRVVGGTAAAVADLAATAVWHDPWPGVAAGGWGYAATDPHPGAARDWSEAIVDIAEYARFADAAGRGERAVAGRLAAEALRIAAWRPRAETESDGKTLPHEVDWLRTAVHLEKGCYRGQETVAKVHNLGHPPRRLVGLQLDGSDAQLPAPGATVSVAGVPVGAVTAAARHYEEGPIALALVKRSTPVDAPVTVETDGGIVAAAQETIVPPDAGRTASIPRMPRLSRRR